MTTQSKYRPDIDGLRAIAVTAVLAYHFFPGRLTGGFIGVDVFFVISGFLISGILFHHLEAGDSSYVDFYSRRIRRIFPALITVLLFNLIAGLFLLLPDELKFFNRQLVASSFFSFNFLMAKEANYFDVAAQKSPLLHLWSLGIEEQFYIFWPFILAISWKARRHFSRLLFFLMGLSFALNLFLIRDFPTTTFYLPFTRFWELLAGGILAWFSLSRKPSEVLRSPAFNNGASIFGLLLISISAYRFDPQLAFPGWFAVLPVLGSALLIAAGPKALVNHKFLSLRPCVFIGLISYPLYLWHWSILTWYRYALDHADPSSQWARTITRLPHAVPSVVMIGLSLLLAFLTYELIEKPVRNPSFLGRKTLSLAAMGLLILPGSSYLSLHIVNMRDPQLSGRYLLERYDASLDSSPYRQRVVKIYRQDCSFYQGEEIRDSLSEDCYQPKTRPVLLLWGDSHAQHLRYGLDNTIGSAKVTYPPVDILEVSSSSCHPSFTRIDELDREKIACNKANRYARDLIKRVKPDVVVISQAVGQLDTDWKVFFNKTLKLGAEHIIFVGPFPLWKESLPRIILRHYWPDFPVRLNHYLERDRFDLDRKLKHEVQNLPSVTYVSPIDFFCNGDGCMTHIENTPDLIVYDQGHLTEEGSILFSKGSLAKSVRDALRKK